jgi:thiamine biosynthesis lipoprotein
MDAAMRSVALPAAVRLDLGGIAKGWAADQAVRRLAAHGPALVDAGGDIAVSGPRAGGLRWPVAVASPFAPERHLAVLWLAGGGVATSGKDLRRWRRDGEWRHHIIDPRTGRPAVTDVLTATVIANSARAAEAAAKTAFILGRRKGMAWIEARSALAAVLVTDDGEVHTSWRLGKYLGA